MDAVSVRSNERQLANHEHWCHPTKSLVKGNWKIKEEEAPVARPYLANSSFHSPEQLCLGM